MITGLQIRAARAALNWSATRLSREAGVALRTIVRFEETNGVPPSRTNTLLRVETTLRAAGIAFVGEPDVGPGIRLWSSSSTAARTNADHLVGEAE